MYEDGFRDLQISTEDYTKTKRFKAVSRHKKKTDADKRAERERNKGHKSRKINENGWWVVYVRS